ncbi:hypothetical protein COLO4_03829 [Corchorus olitorius]|uniref:Uncharacterized protein n=1 Tax=Corchorus olitorius TaxID=93759 RepID=A0A1R3KSK6_9ROSI|nr:hypothetical protein COLO4_04838 [Corchorus olitorius]OMP11416.1 hypothetical protein COLO4_03829 [Corchorus olitorius]
MSCVESGEFERKRLNSLWWERGSEKDETLLQACEAGELAEGIFSADFDPMIWMN